MVTSAAAHLNAEPIRDPDHSKRAHLDPEHPLHARERAPQFTLKPPAVRKSTEHPSPLLSSDRQ